MTHEDQCVTRFRTHKAAALLAYLALHPGKAFSRDLLIDLFWPGREPEAGRANLSNALTSLRGQFEKTRGLAGSVFLTDHHTVRLNAQTVATDVQAFENLLQRVSRAASTSHQSEILTEAIGCYEEDLLTGFFEEWALAEQRRLRELYLQALRQQCLLLEQSGHLEAALIMTTRLIAADRLEESAYQNQMRLCLALDRPQEALDAYDALTALLRSELGASPLAATQQWAEKARSAPAPLTTASPIPLPLTPLPQQQPLPAPGQSTAPLPAPPVRRTSSLPLQLTRFFGRETEIRHLERLLTTNSTRLVTLLGPGGAGKTRLAIEVARRLAANFAAGVLFVSLADLREPSLLPLLLVKALQLTPAAEADPFEQALLALSTRPCLLLLDNLEQLLDETISVSLDPVVRQNSVRELVRTVLERAPHIVCLITSRQPLGLAGEQEFPVPALLIPDDPFPAGTDNMQPVFPALRAYASVALYEDRVRLVKPDFVVTPANAPSIVALCRRLEGMPLAIEMAAAWGRTLSPQKTLERLAKRLDLSVSRRSDLPMRHQSLRATIEWSYDLLSPPLQSLFVALSVFRGGWTLEAVEGVCGTDVPAFLELIERSLVVSEEREAGEVRYRLMETLQEFATEKREERGESEALSARHAAYFLQMAEAVEPKQPGAEHRLRRLETEHDNLRAAMTWCRSTPNEAQMGLRFCGALAHFWEMHGYLAEGYAWCVTALQAEGAHERTPARVKALCGAGRLAEFQAEVGVERGYFEECLAIAEERGDQRYRAIALNNLALIAHRVGDRQTARRLYTDALALNRAMGNRTAQASNLNNMGLLCCTEGDYSAAQSLYEDVLALNRELGNRIAETGNLNNLGIVYFRQGKLGAARKMIEEALALNREQGNRLWEAANLKNLGDIRFEEGDEETALLLYAEALSLNQEMGYRARAASNLNQLGKVHHHKGDYALARTCYRESLEISMETEDREDLIEVWECSAFLLAAETGLVSVRTQSARSAPEPIWSAPPMRANDLPLREDTRVSLQQAAQLWGAAQSFRDQFGVPAPQRQKLRNDNMATVRIWLGDNAMEAAMAEGRALSLEQAITFARAQLR